MRRLLAIALLAFFGLPFVSPLLALSAKSSTSVPICCRRNGAHHCLMGDGDGANPQDAPVVSTPQQKCPYCPASVAIIHGDVFAVPVAQAVYAGLIAHPAVAVQTESKLRISRGRSRQKRGPPSSFSL